MVMFDGLILLAWIYPALMVRLGPAQGHNWWGLWTELALASAQCLMTLETTLWEQEKSAGRRCRPQLPCRWFGGGMLREKSVRVIALSLLLVSLAGAVAQRIGGGLGLRP